MDNKAFSRVEIKDADKGQVTAVFSTFDVIDHDNDVTVKGAIEDGASVVISAYNHQSWKGALPAGVGKIRVSGNEAHLEGQFFMNTTHGRDTFETVKALGEQGLGEWSYGFDVVKSEPGQHEGKSVRMLKELKIHEVSPVLRGAGTETRTLVTKAADDEDSGAVARVKAAIKAAGDDPKKRAAAMALARKNDLEDLIPSSWMAKKSLYEEISEAVDAAEVAVKSAERVVALRAEKNKALSQVNTESLDGLRKTLKALDELLDTQEEADEVEETTEDDEAFSREWLRSIANEL